MKRLGILRWIETKRAPRQKDNFGGSYVPSGIDIYTTDEPGLVSFDNYSHERYRVSDLLDALDELDRFESRRCKLPGEKVELSIEVVKRDSDKGDVFHRATSLRATPHAEHEGYICLTALGGSMGLSTSTAERDSLRKALENQAKLAAMEAEDKQRYPEVKSG